MNLHAQQFDLFTLKLFIAVVEELSIAKAAEREHIAISAASKRITELEGSLNLTLLRRHARGVEPTASGLALVRHARIMLRYLQEMESELQDFAHGLRGNVRVYANISAIVEFLPTELAAFLAEHPQLRIDLEERISPDIVRAVADNQADIGILGGGTPTGALQVFDYRQDELAVVVPAAHPCSSLQAMSFADILDCDFVGTREGSSIDTLCAEAAAAMNRQFTPRMRVSGFDAVARMVQAGLGIGIIPKEVTQSVIRMENISVLHLSEPWAIRTLHICVRDIAKLTEGSRRFVDFLRKR